MNPNMKWCPRPNCNHYVTKGKKKKVVCECGFAICFECGLAWHGSKSCLKAMDKDFFDWAAKSKDVGNCPMCKVRI